MSKCEYCIDEVCVNADCPLRADFCPVVDTPEVCKHEKRVDTNGQFSNEMEKAKAHFEYGIKCDIFQEPVTSYAKTAISALEKQIPQKPIDDADGGPWCICPACSGSVYLRNVLEHIQNQEATYCEHCGQALDWSDTE